MKTIKVIFVLILFFIAVGSACTSADHSADNSVAATPCHDPRPQICTNDYTPVCALLKNGVLKTYGNGCTACSDSAVDSFKPGECKE